MSVLVLRSGPGYVTGARGSSTSGAMTAATVTARLEVYERATAPLLSYYRAHALLRETDGSGKPEEVLRRITTALGVSQSLSPS